MWLERLHRDERGVALVFALMAMIILGGLVVVFTSRTVFQTQATGMARDQEAAIHVAEAGAEALLAEINVEESDFTSQVVTPSAVPSGTCTADPTQDVCHLDADSHLYNPGTLTGDALRTWERQWALEIARNSCELIVVEGGESCAIRPKVIQGGVDVATDLVFGVGFVPSMDAPNHRTRVVKMKIARRHFVPNDALRTEGKLTLGGSASILAPDCNTDMPDSDDCNADVYAIEDVTLTGGAHQIQGGLATGGTITGTPNLVGGEPLENEQRPEIPPIEARDFYVEVQEPNPDPGHEDVYWYDLCPDGTMKAQVPNGTPCTGTQIWPAPDNTGTNYLGWSYNAGTNTWVAQQIGAGMFYVYHADADITGSAGNTPRSVTVFAEASEALPDSSGSIKVGGNPSLVGAYPDVVFVADRDLKMKGTASGGSIDCSPSQSCEDLEMDFQTYSGLLVAGNQLDVSGTVNLTGALIVFDQEDVHTLVTRNTDGINGTMTLKFDDNLDIELLGRVVVEYWNEL